MRVLIVGGSGMIGSNAAKLLAERGDDVAIMARAAPDPGSFAARLPVLIDDYTDSRLPLGALSRFDAVLFSAGSDIRHVRRDTDREAFWRRTQIDGVPAFFVRVRDAGVPRLVHLGSFYHQALPRLIDTNDYVRARALADERGRALSTDDFAVSTLNPPAIVGIVPGTPSPRYERLIAWARGETDIPFHAPPGGTNYMSAFSLAQAACGALDRAEAGKAYLLGGENLSYRAYLQLFLDAVGNPHRLETRDEDHPLLPVAAMVAGRGTVLDYEPDPVESALLGYRRRDVRRAVEEIVAVHGTP